MLRHTHRRSRVPAQTHASPSDSPSRVPPIMSQCCCSAAWRWISEREKLQSKEYEKLSFKFEITELKEQLKHLLSHLGIESLHTVSHYLNVLNSLFTFFDLAFLTPKSYLLSACLKSLPAGVQASVWSCPLGVSRSPVGLHSKKKNVRYDFQNLRLIILVLCLTASRAPP